MERPTLRTLRELDALRSPLLVATFVRRNGFNSTAAATLAQYAQHHDAEIIAEIDPDLFYDFTVMPPSVRPTDGKRVIEWPKNEVRLIRAEGSERDVLVLAGIEPHLRWQTFSTALHGFITSHAIHDLLVLRTWPAAVPHTRPTVMRLSSASDEMASKLGLTANRTPYRGPVDFGGVLSALHINAGGEAAGLTAVVANYLGVVPNPYAMVALTKSIDRLAGTETPTDDFQEAADQLGVRANEEMERSEDLRRAVHELEDSYESIVEQMTGEVTGATPGDELPSHTELLRDVERFLQGESPSD
ncbi:MAG: PAC2 family protein [Chloroflexi bacterium]|nr:PAC2 family protein [Chloroflexota bacterium]MDA1147618.1 PAC2 family protein [Chloroflexota bacterium]